MTNFEHFCNVGPKNCAKAFVEAIYRSAINLRENYDKVKREDYEKYVEKFEKWFNSEYEPKIALPIIRFYDCK